MNALGGRPLPGVLEVSQKKAGYFLPSQVIDTNLHEVSSKNHAGPSPRLRWAKPGPSPLRNPKAVVRTLLEGVLIEEANHFTRSIRPSWVRVGAAQATAKPRVTAAMHSPVFKYGAAGRIPVHRARVRVTARHLSTFGRGVGTRRTVLAQRSRDQVLAVAGMHRSIPVAVEHDRRHRRFSALGAGVVAGHRRPYSAHHRERGQKIVRASAGETRVDPDGGVDIRVGRAHHGGHWAASREPRHIDLALVDTVL